VTVEEVDVRRWIEEARWGSREALERLPDLLRVWKVPGR
jgi:hypothetical protein